MLELRGRKGPQNCEILNMKISAVQGTHLKEGFLFGVELEVEGEGVNLEGVPHRNWKKVAEGSLRGECCEYVFSAPCDYSESVKRVQKLFELFKKNDVFLHSSYRTSTHVHLNFSDKTVKQVINFFFLHTLFEELFEHYCGDTRKGNLFCLSCRDNERLLSILEHSLFTHNNFFGFDNDVRYNACNLAALNKFGSIEIRTMRGADSAEQVIDWLDMLNQLYLFACSEDCPPPWKLCEKLSHLGPRQFLSMCFNDDTVNRLLKTWPATADLNRSLLNGVRLIQMFSYKLQVPWEAPVPEVVEKPQPNPYTVNIQWDAAPVGAAIPAQLEPRLQNDRIELPDGKTWWVTARANTPDKQREEVDGVDYVFAKGLDCWVDFDTYTPCRWIVYDGQTLRQGSGLDGVVNAHFYDHHEVDDGDPDWNPFERDGDED